MAFLLTSSVAVGCRGDADDDAPRAERVERSVDAYCEAARPLFSDRRSAPEDAVAMEAYFEEVLAGLRTMASTAPEEIRVDVEHELADGETADRIMASFDYDYDALTDSAKAELDGLHDQERLARIEEFHETACGFETPETLATVGDAIGS